MMMMLNFHYTDVTIDLTQAHKIYLQTRKDALTDAYTYTEETPWFDEYGDNKHTIRLLKEINESSTHQYYSKDKK